MNPVCRAAEVTLVIFKNTLKDSKIVFRLWMDVYNESELFSLSHLFTGSERRSRRLRYGCRTECAKLSLCTQRVATQRQLQCESISGRTRSVMEPNGHERITTRFLYSSHSSTYMWNQFLDKPCQAGHCNLMLLYWKTFHTLWRSRLQKCSLLRNDSSIICLSWQELLLGRR